MKVTDEMVERALDYLDGQVSAKRVLKALEAALADVPEPTKQLPGETDAKCLVALLRATTALHDAEAKLAKIRAMAPDGTWNEVLGVLDSDQ